MVIRVIEDYPSTQGFARFLRFVVAVLGVILLVVGMLAAAFALVVGGLLALSRGRAETDVYLWLAALIAVMALGVWLGVRALRGKRRLGLFLRRFGYRDATMIMSYTVAGRSGRAWRMVTLDDANIAPVGTARRSRRPLILLALLAFALAGYGGYAVFFTPLLEPAPAEAPAVTSIDDFMRGLVGSIVVTVVAVVAAALILIAVAVALVIGIAGGMAGRAVKASHERARVVVARGEDVVRAAAAIRRNNRRVFGSRLVVCRVATQLWQDVVQELAAVSDAVVIDVSHATDNVVWEVETMREAKDLRWVLVCQRDRIAGLMRAADDDGTGATPVAAIKLARLLNGHDVLVYGNSPREQRRFSRSLRNRLDVSARVVARSPG